MKTLYERIQSTQRFCQDFVDNSLQGKSYSAAVSSMNFWPPERKTLLPRLSAHFDIYTRGLNGIDVGVFDSNALPLSRQELTGLCDFVGEVYFVSIDGKLSRIHESTGNCDFAGAKLEMEKSDGRDKVKWSSTIIYNVQQENQVIVKNSRIKKEEGSFYYNFLLLFGFFQKTRNDKSILAYDSSIIPKAYLWLSENGYNIEVKVKGTNGEIRISSSKEERDLYYHHMGIEGKFDPHSAQLEERVAQFELNLRKYRNLNIAEVPLKSSSFTISYDIPLYPTLRKAFQSIEPFPRRSKSLFPWRRKTKRMIILSRSLDPVWVQHATLKDQMRYLIGLPKSIWFAYTNWKNKVLFTESIQTEAITGKEKILLV